MELPHFVQIEPVGQCNLRCQMCPVRLRHDGPPHGVAFMDYAAFTRLIEGHTIGNHTYSHPGLVALAEAGGDVVGEIARTDALIREHTSGKPIFFRAPYESSCEGIIER